MLRVHVGAPAEGALGGCGVGTWSPGTLCRTEADMLLFRHVQTPGGSRYEGGLRGRSGWRARGPWEGPAGQSRAKPGTGPEPSVPCVETGPPAA